MIPAALVPLATQLGLPLIRKVLERRIGARNTRLAEDVVSAISERVGVPVDQLDGYAADNPDVMSAAMRDVEFATPEMLALYEQANDHQMDLQRAEMSKGPWWSWAWRPFWMFLLGFIWLWNIVLLHVANAIWKIALPVTDMTTLLGLTSLFAGLYMGGHTIKEVAKSWGTR